MVQQPFLSQGPGASWEREGTCRVPEGKNDACPVMVGTHSSHLSREKSVLGLKEVLK